MLPNLDPASLLATLPGPADFSDEERLAMMLAEKSLYKFTEYVWPVCKPSRRFVGGWHIGAICEHLEAVSRDEILNLLINVPPRSTKSTIVAVAWPAWDWLRTAGRQFLFSSYAMNLSIRDSIACRRLVESPFFRKRWGDRFRLTSDQNAKILWENDHSGRRYCTSVGGVGTGEGGDILVVDDAHNVGEIESVAIRLGTLDWWDQEFYNRVNDPIRGKRVVVGQRPPHEDDLSGHILKQGGFEHLCIPEEFEPNRKCFTSIGWEDPRQTDGELMRPERFGPEQVEKAKRTLGPRGYSAQHQQAPTPREGNLIKGRWLEQTYTNTGDAWRIDGQSTTVRQYLWRHVECWTCVIVDPAKSKRKTADFCCFGAFSITPTYKILVRDIVNERLGYEQIVPRLNEFCGRYEPNWVAIESDGFQIFVAEEARATVERNGRWVKKHEHIPTIYELETEGKSKIVRAQPLIIKLEQGEFFFPSDARQRWIEPVRTQLTTVTGHEDEHDDILDVFSWLVLALDRLGGMIDGGEPLVLGARPARY